MSILRNHFRTGDLRGDIYGGITAGVVALPLALAFGEASGAGPIAGLWGAIIVGFFASLFGGTGSQVTGPTGPMVVVFAGVYAALGGSPGLVFAAVLLAGLIQIVFGVLRLGQYIRLVPYPVISGFMSGIGCIIIALQLSRLFGHEPEQAGTIPALTAVPGAVMDPNWAALFIGALSLVMIFTWPAKWGRILPSPLAALIVGTVLGTFLKGVPVLGEIPTGFPALVMPEFDQATFLIVLEAAFILAVLGAIDSLLTSLVADNMTRTRHNSDMELVGQGIGNSIAGLFGAIPGAGATMRTVINIRTGGSSRISGMLHSVLLLAVVISLAPLASQIPHAVLAGILVKVGWDIIDFGYLKRAHRGPRWDLILMATVLGLTVFVDLITAVAVGVVLAALAFVKRLADDQLADLNSDKDPASVTELEQTILDRNRGRLLLFEFGGPLSFGAAADLGHHVREKVRDHSSALVLDFHRVTFIDLSTARAVETVVNDAHAAGRMVYVCGMSNDVRNVLESMGSFSNLPSDGQQASRIDALQAAEQWIEHGDDVPSSDDVAPAPAAG